MIDFKRLKRENLEAQARLNADIEQRRLAREAGILSDWQAPEEKAGNANIKSSETDWQHDQRIMRMVDEKIWTARRELIENVGAVLGEQVKEIQDAARELLQRIVDLEIAGKHKQDAASTVLAQDLTDLKDSMGLLLRKIAPTEIVPIKRAN